MILDSRGISLLELVVASAIFGVVALLASTVMISSQREVSSEFKRTRSRVDFYSVAAQLQKELPSGDLRIFAFSGVSQSGVSEAKPLMRGLFPQPGRCRDQSTEGTCADQASFLYVGYDRTNAAAVNAFCHLTPGSGSGPAGPQVLLVDLHNQVYGASGWDPARVSFTTGPVGSSGTGYLIPVSVSKTVMLLDPPLASLWEVSRAPSKATMSQDSEGRVTYAGDLLPQECVDRLDSSTGPTHHIDDIYRIEIRPYLMSELTGRSNVSKADAASSIGRLPLRLMAATLRAVGPSRKANGTMDFGVSDCNADRAGSGITCGNSTRSYVEEVSQVRVAAEFSFQLFDASRSPASSTLFELRSENQAAASWCTSDTSCQELIVPNNGLIPVMYGDSEEVVDMRSGGYSLIKAEAISALHFHLQTKDGREGVASVPLR